MTDKIEIQGKTVEAAVSEALLQMGARRDEVEIKVIEEPKSGFMGFLGGHPARVLVRKKRSNRRSGSDRDYRVNDEDYKAHTLSGDRGRSRRSSRRRSSEGSSETRDDTRQASREPKREEKSGSRRGSRGRGGRGRGQEATGRSPKQDQKQDREQDRKQDQKQDQRQDQPSEHGSRNRRGNARDNRGRDGVGDTPRRDNRNRAPKESSRPARPPRDNSVPRGEVPIRSLKREPADASETLDMTTVQNDQYVKNTPASVEEPKPTEQKEKTSVTKQNKSRRAFGGLGSRLREKRAAAQTETTAIEEHPTEPTERPSPASPAPERTMRERRAPSFAPGHADEEVILGGIKGVKYAKALGPVTEEGLDSALTELTDGMLVRTGFPCRCETLPGEYRQVKVTTDDASAGMLIGRHGQTVDAVEHLVERMASNAIDARARINLDINNYRMRREEALGERVAEAAEQIRETGQPFHMEPMSARERRIVHMASEGFGGLRTFTMDSSGGKHVVIALEQDAREEVHDSAQANGAEPTADHQGDSAEELNSSDA